MTRWIIASICALSLVAIFIAAPFLGSQITGTSLFIFGFGWTQLLFLVGAVFSLFTVRYRRRQPVSRASEVVSLGAHLLSFAYGSVVSTMAVMQSDYPFADTQIGFLANLLSSLDFLCFGLLIWALAGIIARR